MRTVCAYCRKLLSETPADPDGVSHGMCTSCERYFSRLWDGMSLGEYLEELPFPVAVVDADGRLAAANSRLGKLAGAATCSMAGITAGRALACARSRLPEGCGHTVHCRECAIRRTVNEVARTGEARTGVPAYLDTGAGVLELIVSVRPHQGSFLVAVARAGTTLS